jgi:hypothetical protein
LDFVRRDIDMVTLIVTAFARDYYYYLSSVLKVDPRSTKYKLCTEVEHIRGYDRSTKCIELIGAYPGYQNQQRFNRVLYFASQRYEIEKVEF